MGRQNTGMLVARRVLTSVLLRVFVAQVDIKGKRAIVPEWNSIVAFRVPRMHEVTTCKTNRCRYSVFGWFL